MKKHHTGWQVPMAGALLLATAASAEQNELTQQLDSTNRVTASLRLGFNFSGKFKGVGTTFAPGAPLTGARRTPHGDAYNYGDGYVYADKSGSLDGMTSYWGYDNANQVGASVANSIDFHRTDATGLPGTRSDADTPSVGFEVAYNYQLGRDDWRHLNYGIEGAANFMPVSFGGSGTYNLALRSITDTYGYTAGTTPPSANLPYQGSFEGPGFLLNIPRTGRTTQLGNATFQVQQDFDGDLWGFRVGPYLEYAPSPKWSLYLSGGLAVGIMTADASWKETLTLPGGGPGSSTSVSGSGSDVSLLGGFYVGADAQYKFNERWSVDGGVQFQDIGTYNHNFGGRNVEVDLSQSIFIHAGVSYSF